MLELINCLDKNKINSTSLLGQSIYRRILRISRKQGETWSEKLLNDSQLKQKEVTNIFQKNLVDEHSFSFAQPIGLSSIKKRPTSHQVLAQSPEIPNENDDPDEFIVKKNFMDDPLTLDSLQSSGKLKRNSDLNVGRDITNLYNNPHIKGEKILRPSEQMQLSGYFSSKYRYHSPPVRERDSKIELKRTSTYENIERLRIDKYNLLEPDVINQSQDKLQMNNNKATQYIRTASGTERDSKIGYISTAGGEDDEQESKVRNLHSIRVIDSVNSFGKYLESIDMEQLKTQRSEDKAMFIRLN